MRSWSSTFVATVAIEVRRWVRQPLAVLSVTALPVAFAVLVTVAFDSAAAEVRATIGVVDLDRGPVAARFSSQALEHESVRDVVDAVAVGTTAEARRWLDDGEVDAVVVLPEGLSSSILSSRPVAPAIEVWEGDDGFDQLSVDIARLLVDQFTVRAHATSLTLASGGSDADWPLEVAVESPGGTSLDAAQHFGPAAGLFFVLVAEGIAAQRLVVDRRRGVVERLASMPVSPSSVILGRAVGAVVLGAVSLGITALAMQVLFGRSWGPLGPVALLTIVTAVAFVGVAAVLGVVGRTSEQVTALAAAVAFVFALASGSLAPPGTAGVSGWFADLVPTTHALQGFALLSTEHAGVGDILPSLAWLLAFGTAGAVAAGAMSRRLS